MIIWLVCQEIKLIFILATLNIDVKLMQENDEN